MPSKSACPNEQTLKIIMKALPSTGQLLLARLRLMTDQQINSQTERPVKNCMPMISDLWA